MATTDATDDDMHALTRQLAEGCRRAGLNAEVTDRACRLSAGGRRVIRWPDPPRNSDDTADAVRLYEQMWSIERIAGLFGTNYEAMRRLIARHGVLRNNDRGRAK